VKTTLGEISAATFSKDEREDLAILLRTSLESDRSLSTDSSIISSNLRLRGSLLSVFVAFRDQAQPPEMRTVMFSADPAPPGDLAAWRALAHLPLDLPPFPALVPENPIQ
jgi:hypothetical protein